MTDPDSLQPQRTLEIPGLVFFQPGTGGMTKIAVETLWSRAEIYLHGAQVTAFQKHGEAPLLYLSSRSRFADGQAIRGGIPICFPWFGARAGDVSHGFARLTDWEVVQVSAAPGGGATVRLRLPETAAGQSWPRFRAEFAVTVTDTLGLELHVTNLAGDEVLEFENCLHTYFAVGDVSAISIRGLQFGTYLDHTQHDAAVPDPDPAIRIRQQTDRLYFNTFGPVQILDPVLGRTIHIHKFGSASTVVWNPWTTQLLADLGPDEYQRMVCVESGNVGPNRLRLAPGVAGALSVTLSTQAGPP
jgi:glucose-6-phosphate 1-epimerase